MPLLHRKPFSKNPVPRGLRDTDEVFYCELTKEIFLSYEWVGSTKVYTFPVDCVLLYHRVITRVSHGAQRPIDSRAAPTFGDWRVRSARVHFFGLFPFDPLFTFRLEVKTLTCFHWMVNGSLSPRFFPRSYFDSFFPTYSRLIFLRYWRPRWNILNFLLLSIVKNEFYCTHISNDLSLELNSIYYCVKDSWRILLSDL